LIWLLNFCMLKLIFFLNIFGLKLCLFLLIYQSVLLFKYSWFYIFILLSCILNIFDFINLFHLVLFCFCNNFFFLLRNYFVFQRILLGTWSLQKYRLPTFKYFALLSACTIFIIISFIDFSKLFWLSCFIFLSHYIFQI
jgi:hypothetical protein